MTTMKTDEQVELFVSARQHFGDEHQMKKCAEECCELATAILRFVNGCDGHTVEECVDNVMEELVDVNIMLNQMWGIFGPWCNSSGLTLKDIEDKKLQRLKFRIEEGQHVEA